MMCYFVAFRKGMVMNKFNLILLFTTFLIIFGCSEEPKTESKTEEEETTKTHMLSEQEKMIQKAKDADKLIQEADEKRRKALEDQG